MWPSNLVEQGQVSLQPMSVPMYAAQPYGTSSQGVYAPAGAAAGFDSWALAQAAAQGYGTVSRYPSPHGHMVQTHIASPHAMAHHLVASPQHHVMQGHAIQAPGSPAMMMAWPATHPAMTGMRQQHTSGLTPVALPTGHVPDNAMLWQQQQQQQQHHARFANGYNGSVLGMYKSGQQQQQQQPKPGARPRRNIVLNTKPGDYSDAAVEEFAWAVRKTPASEQLDRKLLEHGLQNLDSRGLAALLKELAKGHHGRRAREVFEYLRSLPADHQLTQLCDVFTYTAMVSLCVDQQELSRAFELVGEMKHREVERNVHTYTALMNVAIKCGQLQRAQEVYNDLLREGCVPNVVTYNTLIDLYGKTGQWSDALRVIHQMNASNIKPVTRTYNTLMIACNTSGQWQEALNVYAEMVRMSHMPNTTTYNALISAYSKAGRLEKVMDTYKEMLRTGCERSVITYSALISACEKAGQWQLALNLFGEMLKEKCDPNVITYNSLITACAQGAQWQKAAEVFQKMKSSGCKPDVVTYTALVSAYERGGQWMKAFEAFQEMQQQGCRADAILYNTLLDVLWDTGVSWAQQRAAQLFRQAMDEGHFRLLPQPDKAAQQQQPSETSAAGSPTKTAADASRSSSAAAVAAAAGGQSKLELGLQGVSPGVAMLMLHCWFADLREYVQQENMNNLPDKVFVSTGRSRQRDHISVVLRDGTLALLASWQSPFVISSTECSSSSNGSSGNSCNSRLEASGSAVADWLSQDMVHHLLAPFAMQPRGNGSHRNLAGGLAAEAALEKRCKDAYSAVKAFEDTHNLSVQNMGSSFIAARAGLVEAMLEAGAKLASRNDVVHDAVLLLDRAMSASLKAKEDAYTCLTAACLHLTLAEANSSTAVPSLSDVCSAVGCSSSHEVEELERELKLVLKDDTSSISALHCLKLYLERLGFKFKPDGTCDKQGTITDLLELVSRAAMDKEFLNYRPTITAAAVLYCDRLQKGLLPFWPSSLATLTGYSNARTAELAAAISGAQRLCKQLSQFQKDGSVCSSVAQGAGRLAASDGDSPVGTAISTPSVAPVKVSVVTAQLNSKAPAWPSHQQHTPAASIEAAPAPTAVEHVGLAGSPADAAVAPAVGSAVGEITGKLAQAVVAEASAAKAATTAANTFACGPGAAQSVHTAAAE